MRFVGSMHLEKEKDKDIEVKWNEVTNLHRSYVCTCPTTVWRTCDTHFSIYLAWLMKPSSDNSIFLLSNNRLSSDIYNSPWIQLLECKDGRSSPLKLYVLCVYPFLSLVGYMVLECAFLEVYLGKMTWNAISMASKVQNVVWDPKLCLLLFDKAKNLCLMSLRSIR